MAPPFAPGTFCWIELATSDDQAAPEFYGKLFGWTFRSSPMPEGGTYTTSLLGERKVGGIHKIGPQHAGVPPHWMLYLAVTSADAAAKAAQDAGGAVVEAPFDVMDLGRMALLRDPTGAYFAVWEPRKHPGSEAYRVGPGGWGWAELMTRDPDGARAFYERAFGWTAKVSPDYTEFKVGEGGEHFAGMMQIREEWGPMPAHWGLYFDVASVDQSTARAAELGGTVVRNPIDIPNVGRFAGIRDPQGATFLLYEWKA